MGEYIYDTGTPLDEVYFIVKGQFGLVLPHFDDLVYVTFDAGDYFGDIDFVV